MLHSVLLLLHYKNHQCDVLQVFRMARFVRATGI